ncbi:hypothetical protein [Cytophaga sp. FL35]|uniref:hypothetical protein n=1 Tax=Cytophaga sp. FL35 TaxID=1904456 RepID=UPI001653993D|nr:hypothetical protein [Cytophaga sp. FL35]MBC6999171.1 hypothetical protein [Cytophaga sp. FL35]
MTLKICQLLFDFGLVVLIWMVQLIIYPSFKNYAKPDLNQWHPIYVHRIALVVIPLMFGQLGLILVEITKGFSWYSLVNLLLILFVWAFTFSFFAPAHKRISEDNYTPKLIQRLIQKNWVRTVVWTLVFIWNLLWFPW